jgi:quinate dehydrogenase (quinone)
MKMGSATNAGTISTAGGLVFFAGFQDFYIRAYNSETGDMVWQHRLPVGSSATPMTFTSPSGRQFIVVLAGGSAHSRQTGDYLMAFALPKTGRGATPPAN